MSACVRVCVCVRDTHTNTMEQKQAPGMTGGSAFSLNDKLNQSGVLCFNRVGLSYFIWLPLYYLPLLGCLRGLGLLSSTVLS